MNHFRLNYFIICTLATLSFSINAVAEKNLFKVLHTTELASLMKTTAKQLYLYDVNVESTREHVGIIPGSKLLSSSSGYDVKKELPNDKNSTLIFYCANPQCTASHAAANKAVKEGYKNVSVYSDGIYGWKKSEMPLESISNKVSAIEPKEVKALQDLHSAVVIDVREAEERHEVVPQSQSMPTSKLSSDAEWSAFKASLPKDKLIVLHCAMGVRAKKVADRLSKDGFKALYFKSPDQWKAAGLTVEKGPAL